jgi:heptosyltransferase III
MSNPKAVTLIMMDRHLGNFLVSSPVLCKMACVYPNTRVIIDQKHLELSMRIPGFPVKTMAYPSGRGKMADVFQFLRFLITVRRARPELVVDFGGRSSGAILGALSGARDRVCRMGEPYARFYTRQAARSGESVHRIHVYGTIASTAGVKGPWKNPCVIPKPEDAEELYRCCPELAGVPFVCLHVAGGKSYKHWPLDRYARLVHILWEWGLQPVLVGAGPDRTAADRVIRLSCRAPINLVNRLAVGPLVELLRRCRLFIGNDSDPMHLAAAAGAPIVALFGPTDPARWGPLTDRCLIVRGTRPVPPGEGKKSFPEGRLMDSIETEMVIAAAEKQIARFPENPQNNDASSLKKFAPVQESQKIIVEGGSGPCNDVQQLASTLMRGETPQGWERISSSGASIVARSIQQPRRYLKLYLPRGWSDRFKELIRGSRSQRALYASRLLRDLDFYTPEVLQHGCTGSVEYLVSKEAPGMSVTRAVTSYSGHPAFSLAERRVTLQALGREIGRLHAEGIIHGDLRAGNILAQQSPKPRFWFLDNERTGRTFWRLQRSRFRNLVQLNMVREKDLSRTDRVRFLIAYADTLNLSRKSRKQLARQVWEKTQQRHAERAARSRKVRRHHD